MQVARKALLVATAAIIAISTMAFAPVPNTTVHGGDILYAEDGSTAKAIANHTAYQVAWIPVSKLPKTGRPTGGYYGAIAILNRRGEIVYYRHASTAKTVNAFGAFTEHRRHYPSLHALKQALSLDLRRAHDGF